ncbi:unnamed protein product [Oikopleura dioica]|uniref:Uncharacterized protein n=1 Tax=Oikopleura dioica TaxID=34765 RepID=E4XYQ0_OIKDI|nr:unnamed protein product [Oikopleura dioica]
MVKNFISKDFLSPAHRDRFCSACDRCPSESLFKTKPFYNTGWEDEFIKEENLICMKCAKKTLSAGQFKEMVELKEPTKFSCPAKVCSAKVTIINPCRETDK